MMMFGLAASHQMDPDSRDKTGPSECMRGNAGESHRTSKVSLWTHRGDCCAYLDMPLPAVATPCARLTTVDHCIVGDPSLILVSSISGSRGVQMIGSNDRNSRVHHVLFRYGPYCHGTKVDPEY